MFIFFFYSTHFFFFYHFLSTTSLHSSIIYFFCHWKFTNFLLCYPCTKTERNLQRSTTNVFSKDTIKRFFFFYPHPHFFSSVIPFICVCYFFFSKESKTWATKHCRKSLYSLQLDAKPLIIPIQVPNTDPFTSIQDVFPCTNSISIKEQA